MSLPMVVTEQQFYGIVKRKCERMMQILTRRKPDSVFVTSLYMFYDEYKFDQHEIQHNTRQHFIEHCRLLENARQGYKENELRNEEESKIMYYTGNAEKVYACQILENVCSYIEKYLETTLFGVWLWTPTDRVAPEFPAEKQSMMNLTFSLRGYARLMNGNQDVLHAIEHLESNFGFIISNLNTLRDANQHGSVQDQHLAQLKLLGSCSR